MSLILGVTNDTYLNSTCTEAVLNFATIVVRDPVTQVIYVLRK